MLAFIHKKALLATEYKCLMTNAKLGQVINKYKQVERELSKQGRHFVPPSITDVHKNDLLWIPLFCSHLASPTQSPCEYLTTTFSNSLKMHLFSTNQIAMCAAFLLGTLKGAILSVLMIHTYIYTYNQVLKHVDLQCPPKEF